MCFGQPLQVLPSPAFRSRSFLTTMQRSWSGRREARQHRPHAAMAIGRHPAVRPIDSESKAPSCGATDIRSCENRDRDESTRTYRTTTDCQDHLPIKRNRVWPDAFRGYQPWWRAGRVPTRESIRIRAHCGRSPNMREKSSVRPRIPRGAARNRYYREGT